MVNLSWVIIWFEVILSLKINLDKNKFIRVGRVDNIEE